MDLFYTSLTAGLLPAQPDIDPDSAICRCATGPLAGLAAGPLPEQLHFSPSLAICRCATGPVISHNAGLLPERPDIDPDLAICRFATGPLAVILSYHHTENNDPPKDEMPGKGAASFPLPGILPYKSCRIPPANVLIFTA